MNLVVVAFVTTSVASLATLAGVWLLTQTGRPVFPPVLVLASALVLDVIAVVSGIWTPILTSILLLPICTSVGILLGWWIRERRILLIALPVAALSDLISVWAPFGFTRQAMEDAARGGKLLTYMTVSVPFEGEILHVVGFADLMLFALVVVALRNMDVEWLTAFAVPFAGFVLALMVALIGGAIPGIPFLAATTLTFLLISHRDPSSD